MNTIAKIFFLALCIFLCPKILGQSILEVEIVDIRSDKGNILISIFNSPEQFPMKAPPDLRDFKVSKKTIKDKRIVFKIDSLKPGQYALALLDDENDSGDMDYSKAGIPREGFGFSNNINPVVKCPPYKKCQFDLIEGLNKINIKVRYR